MDLRTEGLIQDALEQLMAGRTSLIGVPPNTASPYDQDDIAWDLYQWQGAGPWGGRCA